MMWILSTFALKIVEADVPVNNNEFHYYQNCFWFIGISLTTVGYGDTHAVSELGYIFVCMCCVWSTFNNSVVTFLLVSNLSLKQNEQKSLQLLKNIDNKDQEMEMPIAIGIHDTIEQEEYANEPDEVYGGIDAVTGSGNDLHKSKDMYKHSYQQGDNPMAMESLKNRLGSLYQEIKNR